MTTTSLMLLMFAVAVMPHSTPAQPAMARITGIVVDERDRPLAGVRVGLPCPPAPVRYATSDESGHFRLENLPPANCRLMASKEGYVTAIHPGDAGVIVPDGYTFVIRDGESRDGVRLQLSLGGRVAGRITTPEGEIPTRMRVHLLRREIVNGTERLTALAYGPLRADGVLSSGAVQAGDYFVAVGPIPDDGSAVAPAEFAVTYFPGVVNLSEASVVTVKPGETAADVNFALARVKTHLVSGVALDAAGQPITTGNAGISFATKPAYIRGTVPLDMAGRFVIRGLQPGRYRLWVAKKNASGRDIESATMDVEIGLHDVTELVLNTKPVR
jgi:hypothetical protein